MRHLLFGLLFALAASARAQELSEEDAIKQLAKHDIKVTREEDRVYANARVASAEAAKALELLRYIKRIDNLGLEITDAKLVKSAVDALKYTPALKGMSIRANQGLAEADFEVLNKLDKLETIFLFGSELTAKQMQDLTSLAKQKRLKLLNVSTAKFPQKELKQLEAAFPVRHVTFHQLPSIHFMEPLPIAPEESLTVRLREQKLNAAIADIVEHLREYQGFMGQDQALDHLRLHNLRNAALDMDDAALRSRIIDDYVFLTEKRYKHAKDAIERERRPDGSRMLLLLEYEYADAQLTQQRLRKQGEQKSK